MHKRRKLKDLAVWLPNLPPIPSLPPAHPCTPQLSFSESCFPQLQLIVLGVCSGREVGEVEKRRACLIVCILFLPVFPGLKDYGCVTHTNLGFSLPDSSCNRGSKTHSGLSFTPMLSSICGSLPLPFLGCHFRGNLEPSELLSLQRLLSLFSIQRNPSFSPSLLWHL